MSLATSPQQSATPHSLSEKESLMAAIATDGYAIVPNVLGAEYIARAKKELNAAVAKEAEYHGSTSYKDYGMVLVCALYGGAFIDLFDHEKLTTPFNAVLGDGCIVYAYTSSSMPPRGGNYSTRIHRDCPRVIPGYPTNMGATILLDDFTAENGATYFLPGSHTRATPPSEEEFMAGAKRVIAKAGSVFFFDALLFHMGGTNHTTEWRHALTLNMCRPYMKQRLDIPRVMTSAGTDVSHASQMALQKLGFLSQVPASLDEYYAPPEQRKFKQRNE